MKRPSKTGLFASARTWDAPAVRAILTGAPELVGARDPKGRTALHLACAAKPGSVGLGEPDGVETVTALLVSGADLESVVPMSTDEGDFRATPLWYAVARGENLPLVRFLVQRGADASYSLWAAAWRDDAELCHVLLQARPRLNLRAHGEAPIFYAARLQRLKALDQLITAGADPTIPNDQGLDALEIARVRRLPKEFIERLIELKRRLKP